MEIGIFAKVFARSSLQETLEAIRSHGIRCLQFNMSCVGLPTMPVRVSPEECEHIRLAIQASGLDISAMSGTFNMIHPDVVVRREGLERLAVLGEACHALGTPLITLCTGTRDRDNMWRWHPDNQLRDAWEDLLASMQVAVQIAETFDIILGIEPELSNVVDSARKARRLMDELHSARVKVVMDGSNLLSIHDINRMPQILNEAFDLLGNDIVNVHAKDLMPPGSEAHGAAGTGVMDYDLYLAHLQRVGYQGPLILHTLTEEQVPQSVSFLRQKLSALAA